MSHKDEDSEPQPGNGKAQDLFLKALSGERRKLIFRDEFRRSIDEWGRYYPKYRKITDLPRESAVRLSLLFPPKEKKSPEERKKLCSKRQARLTQKSAQQKRQEVVGDDLPF